MSQAEQPFGVITVNYKSAELVSDLIVRTAPLPVVVINNDAAESSALRVLAARDPRRVRIIEAGANIGFGRGMNIGLRNCAHPHAALLNPDMKIDADALLHLRDTALTTGAAVVSPRLLNARGAVTRTAFDRHLSLATFLVDIVCSRMSSEGATMMLREAVGANRAFGPGGRVRSLNGAAWVVDVGAVMRVGGFDERFFLYGEESELCERLDRAGGVLWFDTGVHAVHLGGGSTDGGRQTERRLRSTILSFEIQGKQVSAAVLKAGMALRYGRESIHDQ